ELGDWQWRQRPYKGLAAYAQTKRGQVILAELLSEHFAGTTLRFNSMHPGWCDTTMVRDSIPRFQRFIGRRLRSHAQGADTAVWLAACQRIADHSGRFWFDRQPQPTHVMSRTVESPDDRARLWSLCTEQCGDLVAPH
ncbi:MAG: dehydrogenase, partial [Myxococcota bacterium]